MDKFILMYHGFGKENKKYSVKFKKIKRDIKILIKKKYSFSCFKDFGKSDKREVCLTFDDGYESNYLISKILEKRGIKGTFFIITENIGKKGYLSSNQIKEMSIKGHEIGSHTLNHTNLSKLTKIEIKKELLESKIQLEKILNIEVDSVSIPGGKYNSRVLLEGLKHYKRIRTSDIDFVGKADTKVYPSIPVFRNLPRKIYLSSSGVFLFGFTKRIKEISRFREKRGNGIIHVHSNYSDGKQSLRELKNWCLKRKINVVFMTDHSEFFNEEKYNRYIQECNELSDSKFIFVPGLEVSTIEGNHIIHINPKYLPKKGLSSYEIVKLAEKNNVPIIIAHINPKKYPKEAKNLEIFNKKQSSTTGFQRFIYLDRIKRNMPETRFFGGADLHKLKENSLLTFNIKFSKDINLLIKSLTEEDKKFKSKDFCIDSYGNLYGNRFLFIYRIFSNYLYTSAKKNLSKINILRELYHLIR